MTQNDPKTTSLRR